MKLLKKKIQSYILKYKVDRISNVKSFVAFDNLKNVLFFCDSATMRDKDVIEFKKLLSSYNIDVSLLVYIPEVHIEDVDIKFALIRDIDISYKGEVLGNDLETVFSAEYDLLFDLRTENNIISDYIAKRIHSRFILGCNDKLDGLDMLISTEGRIRTFMESSIEFLKKLKKS